mgnify:CR=1 FL=1
MTILSPRLALNLNYLLSCCIAFCCAARAKPCHTTPPLSCHATVSLLALRLSCAGWLLHRLLSRCATISLAPAVCWIATSLPTTPTNKSMASSSISSASTSTCPPSSITRVWKDFKSRLRLDRVTFWSDLTWLRLHVCKIWPDLTWLRLPLCQT